MIGYHGFVVKAKRKRREPGRFVTLKTGRVIFIPEGKRTKWADVREKVLASQKGAAIRGKKLDAETSAAAEQGRERMDLWLGEHTGRRKGPLSATGTWVTAGQEGRARLKAQIAGELSEATGISEEDCGKFVKQWAESSNDADMRSLAIQRDAAKEFGLELSDFTKGKIDETLGPQFDGAVRLQRMNTKLAHSNKYGDKEWDAYWKRYHRGQSLEQALASAPDVVRARQSKFSPLIGSADQRKLLRAMYDSTQRSLAVRGITEVRLYRGVGFDDDPENWYHMMDQPIEIETNAMESWSIGQGVASDFAVRASNQQAMGVRFETTVPAERILSCPVTGFGCLTEGEVLVLGGVGRDTAEIGQVYEAPAEGEYS